MSLLNPGNGVSYNAAEQNVVFQYNVSDLSNVTHCNLTVNGAVVNSSVGVYIVNKSAGAVNNFKNNFTQGTYSWNITCADSAGRTNSSSTRTFSVAVVEVAAASAGGTGGGGGGATRVKEQELEITINPKALAVDLLVGEKEEREVKIKNISKVGRDINIVVGGEDIKGIVKINVNSMFLGVGEEKSFMVEIDDAENGLLTGKIVLTSGSLSEEIPVVINVKTENFLFDVQISVLDRFRTVLAGDALKAQVNLLQVGHRDKVDVLVNYIIKDFEGKSYLEESETFFVLEAKDYVKEFPTHNLEPGSYIIGLEVLYPGAFATSSAQFEVQGGIFGGKQGIILIIGGLAVFGVILWWFFGRKTSLILSKRQGLNV